MTINELCDVVRETSFAIHKQHWNGHLEKSHDGLPINFGASERYIKKYVMGQSYVVRAQEYRVTK